MNARFLIIASVILLALGMVTFTLVSAQSVGPVSYSITSGGQQDSAPAQLRQSASGLSLAPAPPRPPSPQHPAPLVQRAAKTTPAFSIPPERFLDARTDLDQIPGGSPLDWIGRAAPAGASLFGQGKTGLAPGGITAGEVITFHTNYAGVEGYAGSSSDLHLELERAGSPAGEMNFRSDGVGYFYAELISAGKRATVEAGDVLTVVVDGTTELDLTVPDITGTVFAITDTIKGNISGVPLPANLTISSHGNYFATTTDGSGDFEVSLASQVDLMWDSWVQVAYQTEPGLWVARYFFPQGGFLVRGTFPAVRGFTDPDTDVSVQVEHNGDVTSRTVTAQKTDGFWEAAFDEFPLIGAGDLVTVTINGSELTATMANLSDSPDFPNDVIEGTGPASSEVTVYGELGQGLFWFNYYQRASTDGSGNFSASFPDDSLDMFFGYYVVHHTQPHADSWIAVTPPLARADWMFNRAFGFAEPSSEVTVTLKDSVGDPLESQTVTAQENDGRFVYAFSTDFLPDYQLAFKGGGLDLTYDLITLTVYQDLSNDDVVGQSPADDILNIYSSGGLNQRGYFDYLAADSSGEYLADLSGIQDQYNGGTALASYPEGNDPDQPAWQRNRQNSPFIGLNETHNGVWGSVPEPRLPVTLTLKKGVDEYTAYAHSDGLGSFDWTQFNDGSIDIEPGDQVTVAIEGWSQAVTAPDLEIFIDAELDQVTGVGPADSFLEVYSYDLDSSIRVPTDGSGNFLVDYSGMIDLIGGSQVEVGYYDENWNYPHAWSQAPFARANTTWDAVDGMFGSNVSVQYTVTTPLGDLKGGASGTAKPDGWMDGIWCGQLTGDCDLLPGDRITVTTDAGFETVMVAITVTGQMDVDLDQISGQMEGGAFPARGDYGIWSQARQEGAGGGFSIDAGGNYTINVSGFDLQVGDEAEVWYIDQNGNRLGAQVYTLRLDVNYAHNWVEVQANPGASVAITVEGKSSISGMTGGDGWFRTHQHNDEWDNGQPNIQTGDNVFVVAGEYSASVEPVGQIDGQLDLDTDLVTGTLTAAHFTQPLRVACEVWVDGGPTVEIADVDPSGGPSSEFTCDFGVIKWDLQPRQDVALVYYEPDGNRVINMLSAPYARANIFHDSVDGSFGPDATVAFTVTDGLGSFKGGGSGQANPDGWLNGVWCGQADGDCDLLPGDQVTVTVDDVFFAVLEPISITLQIDVDAETVSGDMEDGNFPGQGWVEVWNHGRQAGRGLDIDIDSGGGYSADFSPLFDIQSGDMVDAWYFDQNNNWVGNSMSGLRIEVIYSGDWIAAYTFPNAIVTVNVEGGFQLIAPADESGRLRGHMYSGDWTPSQPDIKTGDAVTVTVTGHQATVDPVGEITGQLDLAQDTISGTITAPAWSGKTLMVSCAVWEPGGPAIDLSASADGGSYFCDIGALGWDIRSRQTIAVYYYEKDGDAVINEFWGYEIFLPTLKK